MNAHQKPTTMTMLNLTAKALKCSAVLDPAALINLTIPDGISRVPVKVQIGGRQFSASLNPKSLRKVIATVREAGPDQVAVVLQGKLTGEAIEEAGLAAQLKTPKPPAEVAS
jgi:hypothetical protein